MIIISLCCCTEVTLSLSSISDGGSNLAVDESAGNVLNSVILNRTGESEIDIDVVFEDIPLGNNNCVQYHDQ